MWYSQINVILKHLEKKEEINRKKPMFCDFTFCGYRTQIITEEKYITEVDIISNRTWNGKILRQSQTTKLIFKT